MGATAESLREGLGGLELREVEPGKIFWPLCEETNPQCMGYGASCSIRKYGAGF